jgi:hypothetical protein
VTDHEQADPVAVNAVGGRIRQSEFLDEIGLEGLVKVVTLRNVHRGDGVGRGCEPEKEKEKISLRPPLECGATPAGENEAAGNQEEGAGVQNEMASISTEKVNEVMEKPNGTDMATVSGKSSCRSRSRETACALKKSCAAIVSSQMWIVYVR